MDPLLINWLIGGLLAWLGAQFLHMVPQKILGVKKPEFTSQLCLYQLCSLDCLISLLWDTVL